MTWSRAFIAVVLRFAERASLLDPAFRQDRRPV